MATPERTPHAELAAAAREVAFYPSAAALDRLDQALDQLDDEG